jgi:two-component sensor histidine kinase/ligand-binding sensor domain-containing protein
MRKSNNTPQNDRCVASHAFFETQTEVILLHSSTGRFKNFDPFMLRNLLIFIASCILVWDAASQSIPITSLRLKDGLPQATITCVMQDRHGFIWAGTKDGLTRYNGYEFEVYRHLPSDSSSLSNSYITAITQDLSGNIWVGTNFGLNMLDPLTMKSKRFYHWFQDDMSLSSSKITSLVCDQFGELWIGTENGLNNLLSEDGRFTTYSIRDNDPASLSSNRINAMLIDRHNRLWVGTDFGLNLLLPKGNFKRYRGEYSDNNSLSNNLVLSLAEDYEGHLWIGTRNGLNRLEPTLNVFTRYYADLPLPNFLRSNVINAILVDIDGRIWIGTSKGLNQLYKTQAGPGSSMGEANDFQDLPDGNVSCLAVDRSGLILVGTHSAGLSLLNNDAQRFFSTVHSGEGSELLELNKVFSFQLQDANTLLLGTGAGVMRYGLDTTAQSTRRRWVDGKLLLDTEASVKDMTLGQEGSLWLATDGRGLLEMDSRSGKILKHYKVVPNLESGLPSNKLTCIIPADSACYWIGTLGDGFCHFNSVTGTFCTFRFGGANAAGLRDNNILCLAFQGKNDLWIGTGNAGLYHFDVSKSTLSQFSEGSGAQGDLGSGIINDLHLDGDQNLWVATSGGGLSKLLPEAKTFNTFTVDDGLASNVILSVRSDFEGNLWMATHGGITAYSPKNQTFKNYNEQDIPGFNTYFPSSSYSDNYNRIYFGGANGFNYLYAEGLRDNKYIPPVVISKFNLLGDRNKVNEGKRLKFTGDTVFLQHDHPGFTVEFAALNFKQPEKNQYAYRFRGLFDEWRYLGNRRYATFSNLDPGTYRLEIRGSNNDGYWNNEQATLNLVVNPAFWQTASFQMIVAFFVIALFYGSYLYRIRTEKRRRLQLEQAVKLRTQEIAKERDTNAVLLREVHHRVKNNLQIIVSLLSLQSRFITDRKLISLFDEIQNRVRSMSLIHQKMYQSKDLSTVDIAEYIRDLSESLLKTYRVGQKVNLEVNIEVNRFKSDTLTPLGLIINEIISNALKYAFEEDTKGTIFVEITSIDHLRYRMTIGDNGIGIPEDGSLKHEGSFGTELVEALTEQLNGSITRLRERKGTVYQIDFEDLED